MELWVQAVLRHHCYLFIPPESERFVGLRGYTEGVSFIITVYNEDNSDILSISICNVCGKTNQSLLANYYTRASRSQLEFLIESGILKEILERLEDL